MAEESKAKIKHLENKFAFARYELILSCEPQELQFYLYLKLYAINKHSAYPGQKRLEKDLKWKEEKVRYWVKRMQEKGRLIYEAGSGRKSSLYDITWYDRLNMRGGKILTGGENQTSEVGKYSPELKEIELKGILIGANAPEKTPSIPSIEILPIPSKNSNKDPRVKQVIDFFYSACQEIKGFRPRISGAIEGKMIKGYLQEFSVEELTDEFDWFLKNNVSEKLSCSIKTALCTSVFNDWQKQRANLP